MSSGPALARPAVVHQVGAFFCLLPPSLPFSGTWMRAAERSQTNTVLSMGYPATQAMIIYVV